MVATKLSEVASKGLAWQNSGGSSSAGAGAGGASSMDAGSAASTPSRPTAAARTLTPARPSINTAAESAGSSADNNNTNSGTTSNGASGSPSSFSSPSALWDAASSSLHSAADQAYKAANYYVFDSFGGDSSHHGNSNTMAGSNQTQNSRTGNNGMASSLSASWLQSIVYNNNNHNNNNNNNSTTNLPFSSPWRQLHNPINRVRGRYVENQKRHNSIQAVRSLLPLVTHDHNNNKSHRNNNNNNKRHSYFQPDGGGYPTMIAEAESESYLDEDPTEGGGASTFLTAESEDSKTTTNRQRTSSDDSRRYQRTSSAAVGGGIFRRFRRGSNCPYTPDYSETLADLEGDDAATFYDTSNHNNHNYPHTWRQNSETASQLAEGTIRALRDIALDEAVEFHAALRFWSDRWEHPLLSWLEAGPVVWFSRDGYDHQLVGHKVAQIQAVLARRCTAIGEMQQHLLRAGWQRGVAQWGVLGQGGQWATVQGTYVMTEEDAAAVAGISFRQGQIDDDDYHSYNYYNNNPTPTNNNNNRNNNLAESFEKSMSTPPPPPRPMERIGMSNSSHPPPLSKNSKRVERQRKQWKRQKGYYASVFVRNEDNGRILMDDAALAEWSVDAMALIRNLLERAANGRVKLPYEHHWKPPSATPMPAPATQPHEQRKTQQQPERETSVGEVSEGSHHHQGQLVLDNVEEEPREQQQLQPIVSGEDPETHRALPIWAKWAPKGGLDNNNNIDNEDEDGNMSHDGEEHVVISNLQLMAAEVSELLNCIEHIVPTQMYRRLRKLRPPSMFRRRWYLTAVAAPIATYLFHHWVTKGYDTELIQVTVSKIFRFFYEHVYVPTVAIVEEVWKGREAISDRKARMEVIAGLKEMIRSWLDENHPEIPAKDRLEMAELMDISLIERKKAESMKTIFELNQAVRLTFIEMQFIKKEMVNAMYTMDEMMSANDINMNLAAVTPAVLVFYTAKQLFRFFYYALLKLGKSKEETHASFRQILTDIERLLVMRDNPPTSPFPQHQLRQLAGDTEEASHSQLLLSEAHGSSSVGCNVLSADDLGMLMLHIHECRTILWKDYSRFSPAVIQSVSEDLAELAGERGAVSVQQQLQIISRMCRTYPFLKVISIGTSFHERFTGGPRYFEGLA